MASYASALRVADAEAADSGAAAAVLPTGMRTVVIDSSAIIRGMKIETLADAAVTVPAVFAEVKDGPSRAALAGLPFGLATQEPSDESLAAVRRFARLTGDSAVLSLVDTQLLALAHTLHIAAHGSAHLRDTPAPLRAAPRRRGRNAAAPMPGGVYVDNAAEWEALEREEAEAAAARAGDAPGVAAAEPPAADQHASRVADGVLQLSLDDVKVRAPRARALRARRGAARAALTCVALPHRASAGCSGFDRGGGRRLRV
jgi:RNA-binding protein NOB1